MIVYGDCQAEAVAAVLGRDPVVASRLRVIYSRSYDHPVEGRGNLTETDVSSCAVLCEQHDPACFRQRELLPEDCFTLKFPALDLNLLWPFNCVNPYNAPEPPVAAVTSERMAVIRFHGRNRETWDQKGAPPNVRFRWDYQDQELAEWVPRIQAMAERTQEVHAIMNNNYSNWSVKNAHQLERLLQEAGLEVAPPPAAAFRPGGGQEGLPGLAPPGGPGGKGS